MVLQYSTIGLPPCCQLHHGHAVHPFQYPTTRSNWNTFSSLTKPTIGGTDKALTEYRPSQAERYIFSSHRQIFQSECYNKHICLSSVRQQHLFFISAIRFYLNTGKKKIVKGDLKVRKQKKNQIEKNRTGKRRRRRETISKLNVIYLWQYLYSPRNRQIFLWVRNCWRGKYRLVRVWNLLLSLYWFWNWTSGCWIRTYSIELLLLLFCNRFCYRNPWYIHFCLATKVMKFCAVFCISGGRPMRMW